MGARAVAEALKGLREARGLTQRALAEKAGVGYVTIARLEVAILDPRLSTLERLAKALGVTVAEIIGEGRPTKRRAGR